MKRRITFELNGIKLKSLILLLFIFSKLNGYSQVASYAFSQNNGTYTSITGGTVLITATDHTTSGSTSMDVGFYPATIPFNFNFNGVNYTSCNVNVNGYITFGVTPPTTGGSTPISSTTAYDGAVAIMARDLWGVYGSVGTRTISSVTITSVTDFTGCAIGKPIRGTGIAAGATITAFNIGAGTITMSAAATSTSTATYIGWPNGEIRVEAIGTAPNRIFVIQFSGMADFATAAPSSVSMAFQIQLAEGGGVVANQTISLVYGPSTNLSTTSRTQQVGLRGLTTADFNNRTSTSTWSGTTAGGTNAATVARTNTNFPASGLTFIWSSPSVCTGTPSAGTASTTSTTLCAGSSAVLSLTGYTSGTPGITFQWQQSTNSGGPYVNVTGGSGATTPTYISSGLSQNTYYVCLVTCTNSSQSALSNEVAITITNPQLLSSTPGSHCGPGTVTLQATANIGSTVNWYTASTGGTPVASGTSFTTPILSSNTTYYVAAATGSSNSNVATPTVGTSQFWSAATGWGLRFTANATFTINTVKMYPSNSSAGPASLQVKITDLADVVLYTGTLYNFTSSTSITEHIVPVNITVPPGNYKMQMTSTGINNLVRESSGVTFPYNSPGNEVSITAGANGIGTAQTTTAYYWFYAWNISTGCESFPRTAVAATINTAPAISASASLSLICNGASTSLNVTSTNPDYTYTWTPGNFTGTGISVSPSSTTTYTVNAADNSGNAFAGCTEVGTVTINVQPASAAVTGNPESICAASGTTVLNLNPSTGYVAGSIQWQDSPNGSIYTDIAGATNSSYNSPVLSSSTYYKALIKDGNNSVCLQPFKEIVVGVPSLLTTTSDSRCGTGPVTLQATGSVGSTIRWYAASTGGLFIASGNSFSPTVSGTTTYYAAAETGSGSPTNATVGTGSTTSATYPNPFYSLWSNSHNQHLILASELYAAGMSPGSITAGAINITSAGTLPMLDFSVKMGNTTATNLSTYASPVFTTVFTSPSVMPVVGLNPINFTTPFVWDGVSNIVIEICHGNPSSTATMSRTASMDVTGFVSTIHTHRTTGTSGTVQCGDNTTNVLTYSLRPQFFFTYIPSCSSSRTPVTATVTSAPAITVSSSVTAICPGGTADISVTSPNDPNYSYAWTSSPAGFTASGSGPHSVSPSVTTKYYVNALDNSGGANQGCAMIDSVTITNGGALVAGTVSASQNSLCISGSTLLSVTGASGGTVQWQSSTTSATGPWTNVGTGANTYNSGTITQTTYYQVVVSCNASSVTSNVQTVTVNNPQILSTTPNSRCGYGTVNLGVNVSGGATANWYNSPSGGSPIATGTAFTTPNINSSTDYYVSASAGGFTGNVGKLALEPTASGTGGGLTTYMNFDAITNFNLQTVTLYPYGATDNVAGTVTIELRTSTGTPITSQTVNVVGHNSFATSVPQVVTVNFPVSGGASYRLGVTAWTGGVSNLWRDATGTYPYTLPGVVSITGPSLAPYYYFFYNWQVSTGCEGPRSLVTATINPAPPISVSSTYPAICPGGSTDLIVTSTNDPNYTYTWSSSPAGFNASGAGPHTVSPSVTTKYYLLATDNSGSATQGCAMFDSVTVTNGGVLTAGTISSSQADLCVSGSPTLTASGTSGGALQWQSSTISTSGPWTNVGTGTTTYTANNVTQTTHYRLVVSCQTTSLNTNVVTVTVNNPQLTSSSGASRCGPGPVTLNATSSTGSVNWYANPTGGAPLATGTTYTPNITGTTTYYAAASTGGGGLTNVGAVTNAIGTGSMQNLTHYQKFTVLAATVTIQGVYVYPGAAGNVVLHISNSSGTVLTTITHPVTAADVNLKTFIPVNYAISAGVDYRMGWSSGGVTLFRNDAGAIYPYTLANIISITGNSFDPDYWYYCYDWQIVTGCEGVRVPVVANMTSSPTISVTPTQTTCSNVSKTLTVSSPNDPDYTYTWTPGNLSGASVTVNPATTTTYTVNAIDNTSGPNAGCSNIGTVLVNVNPAPAAPTMTPASALLCEDDTVKLKASGIANTTATFGTQASQNTTTTYPAPYSAYFGSQRTQMLITAAELTAQGFQAGSQFTGIKFPVVTLGTGWGSTITSCNSFQMSIGATNLSSLTAFQSGLTQVVPPANFTPVVGYTNSHTFSAPFVWNGTSNIIIESTFGNNITGTVATSVIQNFTATAYQSTILYRADGVTAAAAAAATTVSSSYSSRADFKLVGTAGGPVTWSPLTELFEDINLTTPYTGGLVDSVYSHPSITRTYTATTTLGSCSASNTVTVTVDVIPQVNITAAGPTSYCPGSTVTLHASTDPTYTNYAWTPAGPSGPGATAYTVGGSTNSSTVYTVTATGAGGCTSHQTIPVTVYDTISPDITVIGNANLCTGQTTSDLQGDIFGATGPAQSYAWSTSETTQLITVFTGGTYSLVTTDVHGCITHNAQVITESIAPTAPIVTPAGPINLCSYDGGNTYNAATLTVTNYSSDLQWSTSETTTSIVVDYPDNFFAIYTDPSGCYSVSNTVATFTNLASDAATGATSDASFNSICLGNTVTLTVAGGFLGDGADWHWYEGSCIGGTPRGTGSSVTLTPTTGGLHTYYVRAEGICNTTTCASISIQVSTAPPPWGASITTYPVAGCNGTSAVMSGPVVSGASFYNWSCAQGGVLFNGSPGPIQTATPSVTVTFVTPPPAGASGYSICVFAGNGCGQSLTFCRFVRARVSQPSTISGSIIACANTNSVYSVGAVAGADTYTWTVTGNATINGGTNTITTPSNSVTVNFLPGWSTGTLSVYASLTCGFNSAARSLAISSTPGVPGIMGGPGYVCPGSSASFNVPAVNGAASYNWTTSVPGAVITPSSNSASILFPAVIPAGSTVCVTAVSSCGNASAARCKSIANGIPNIPGNISGPVSGQCAQSGVSYSVIPVAQATAYLWTATGGASVSGPNNLSAVSINFPSGFVTCTLSVVAQNSCGSSSARTLIVNGAPAQPGTITGNQSVCNGAVESYSTGGSTGATSYGWAVPAGATILNTPPYGASILVMWGATGGNVTVNATNDCGSSSMRTLSVAVTCREAQVSEALQSTATLYPNPTGGKTTLQFDSKANVKYSLQVLDVTGRMILSENISAVEGSNMHELDFTTIAKGMYLVRLESQESGVELLKITVE